MADNKTTFRWSSPARTLTSLATAVLFKCAPLYRTHAENHLDYKYDDYAEEKDRMHVRTHSALFEMGIVPSVSLKASYVHDAISGASPTGAPPPAGSNQVPTAQVEDVRNAGYVESSVRWAGRHTTTPQFAYSLEQDYESIGLALNHQIEFNEKNTVLSLGIGQTFDTVMPEFWGGAHQQKDSTDFLMGLTQLLSPNTVATLNFTYGMSSGYLSDPYKGVRFDGYPDPTSVFPEKRPDHKTKQIVHLSLTQFVKTLNGSGEVSYRFYHDSFEIFSHTATLAWYQKLGKHLILSPMFRYYWQSAADFYGARFPGEPTDPGAPTHYSADYRLSALTTLTYGLSATVIIKERLYLDAAYKRYEMYGNDDVTSASCYPKANVFTVGARLCF